MLGRGDLWIVNEYETSHSWLAPSEEDVFLWRYSNYGAAHDVLSRKNELRHRMCDLGIGDSCVCLRMSIAPDDIYLRVCANVSFLDLQQSVQ